jgi:hypothetical protein
MHLKTMAGLLCAVTAAACADATAPIDSPQGPPASAALSKSHGGSAGTGTISVITPKPVTLPFSTTDCNGYLVTGTSTHYALAIAAQGGAGTFDLTGVFDKVTATGPTGIAYTGSQLVMSTAVLNPNTTVFFTDQNLDLKPASRTLNDTFLDIVTTYVGTSNGPVLSNVSITTRCGAPSKKQ